MTDETPRLVALKVKNFMRVEAFDAVFDGKALTLLCADNAKGKTSILTAIDVGLRGARSKQMPDDPVHDGAKKAEIELDLGTLIAKRTVRAGKMELDVRPKKDGAVKLPSPQAVLDELIGQFLDPLEFDRLDREKRLRVLRDLAGLDFAGTDAAIADYRARRTEIGRDVRRLAGALAELPEPVDDEAGPQSVTDLLAELKRRRDHNDDVASKRSLLADKRGAAQRLMGEIEAKADRIADLRRELAETERDHGDMVARLEVMRADGKTLASEVEQLCEEPTAEIETQIADAEAFAQRAADARRWREIRAERDTAEAEQDRLTAKIKQAEDTRARAIAEASYPIDGLEARDDGVYLHGKPWEQASSAERLSASTAIGFALHPRLKAILIRDGNRLGKKAREQLYADAERLGGQIVMEIVSDDEEIVVRFVEGGEQP